MVSSRKETILAIETSCDESAIAIADFFASQKMRVCSHIVSSQVKIHAAFGGVVPNLARREHQQNLVPILLSALTEAGMLTLQAPADDGAVSAILEREQELLALFKKRLLAVAPPPIDAIAVTYGPGLAPALWVGVNFARALAALWHKPLIPVNHMAGHFFSAFLQKSERERSRLSLNATRLSLERVKFPILGLLVSGGHTELVLVKRPWQFRIIGETRDDAVGEVFDKVARMMGLPYPGGPALSRLAEKGDPKKYPLPSPMLHTKNYDFSFSGLKTAVLYLVRDLPPYETWSHREDIAASFQAAAIEVLVKKTIRAAKEHNAKTVLLGGGVSANHALRLQLTQEIKKYLPSSKFQVPSSDLCGDNALMIAAAAYFLDAKKGSEQAISLRADANARLGKYSYQTPKSGITGLVPAGKSSKPSSPPWSSFTVRRHSLIRRP